ncbi:MAG TPA: YkgJ family cysteine cluster protein [Acidimicrobiales bacterium]|nr:YkgJ family cysteine cluster protein [Acidimicrobiales bacterium]
MSGPAELPAGRFSSWLVRIQDPGGADVPCGTCTACCTSAQFVHIGPDENETLARIPPELLFPAPGRPRGHVVLGYDERGHCPMLRDGGCSIYVHRPRTCRTYDCRVFPASGVDLDDEPAKAGVAERAGRWRFDHPTARDTDEHAAVRAAAAFLRAHAGDVLPAGAVPRAPTQLAYLAVRVHRLFLGGATPAVERVERELP